MASQANQHNFKRLALLIGVTCVLSLSSLFHSQANAQASPTEAEIIALQSRFVEAEIKQWLGPNRQRLSGDWRTHDRPAQTVGLISYHVDGSEQEKYCVGTQIGPRAIITARTCVIDDDDHSHTMHWHPDSTHRVNDTSKRYPISQGYVLDQPQPRYTIRTHNIAVLYLSNAEDGSLPADNSDQIVLSEYSTGLTSGYTFGYWRHDNVMHKERELPCPVAGYDYLMITGCRVTPQEFGAPAFKLVNQGRQAQLFGVINPLTEVANRTMYESSIITGFDASRVADLRLLAEYPYPSSQNLQNGWTEVTIPQSSSSD